MAEYTIFDRLRQFFSANAVVRNIKGKGLRVIDTDNVQMMGRVKTNYMVDRYSRLHGTSMSGVRESKDAFRVQRLQLFRDYDVMDGDAIIASALDVYADESTMKNEFGDVLTIHSDNDKVQAVLRNLFYDVLNIEFNLWPWVRNLCKYGDFYLHLNIADGLGIVSGEPCSTYDMIRREGENPNKPHEVKFELQGGFGQNTSATQKQEFDEGEIAHFRLLSDTNFLPYGKAMIESARKTWKQLQLMEDAMLINRIMRAPEKRVIKVDIGNIPPAEVDNYMQLIMNKMKKVPFVDQTTGEYNLKYNLMNMTEDFYMPVRGGDSGTQIETLGGLEFNGIDDLEYLRNKEMASLKIPKAFLGYEDAVGSKATLAAEDVRFARTIERIQRIVVSELNKIALVHLFVQGFKGGDLVDFELRLFSPSTIYEEEKIALWDSKVSLASSLQETKLFDSNWIYKNIFQIPDADVKKMRLGIVDDLRRAFRYDQIESEGNDPAKSGQSYGTPHDMAVIQQSEGGASDGVKQLTTGFADEEMPEGGWEGSGRPKEGAKFGQDSHVRGRDPVGKDDRKKRGDRTTSHKYKGNNPLSRESVSSLKSVAQILKRKSSDMLLESISISGETSPVVEQPGSMLDEKNILLDGSMDVELVDDK